MENLVINFAKANKIGKVKAAAFAQSLIEQYKAENPAKSGAGRPVSDQTLALRANVVQAVETLQKRGEKATAETIASTIGGNPNKVYLCNALNWAEKEGKLQRIGKDETKQGKGKKPVLWGLRESASA
jgi:hypothetical protein